MTMFTIFVFQIAREAYHTLKGKERMDLQKLAREFVNDYKKASFSILMS